MGSGLRNSVLQAHVYGCHSIGIELDDSCHTALIAFQDALTVAKRNKESQENVTLDQVGKVDLIHGRFEDPAYFALMTTPQHVDEGGKVFCNNYGSVFSSKSNKAWTSHTLDLQFANQFCCMPIGSVVVTRLC
jgi:hypothetical protein